MAMTARRLLGLALALTLLVAAAWASSTRDVRPQTLTLFLLGAGLAVGAHALKRRRTTTNEANGSQRSA